MSAVRRARTLLAALAVAAAPAALHGATAQPVPERTCDVRLNVTDQDPAGLNVRATPGGAVIGTLKARNTWVETHVVGQVGDWMRIDEAVLIDDALADGEKTVFHGRGFVHVSKLGFEVLNPGAAIHAQPSEDAPVVLRTPPDEDHAPKAQLLGCAGAYVQVKVGVVAGWTRQFCSNQRTTCA